MPSPWLCQIFLPLLQRGCQKLLVLGKTLSENCQVEQDVTAGKLNKRQPVLGLLCPARTEAATLAQPRDRALHHPSPRRMNFLRGGGGGGGGGGHSSPDPWAPLLLLGF